MDYIGSKCPVCQKYFHADDDIVVCPECGTPHHRTCYEQVGHCCNEELHAQSYDYTQDNTEETNVRLCPSCGKENDKESFFCKYCGSPLSPNDHTARSTKGYESQQQNANPYTMAFLDPLGGVPNDTDFGDGVTAGEAAKYVKQNTPYFIRIFSNIKNFNKSKFNFAAAVFTGGYLLYRKMYKLGAILMTLQLTMMVVEIYLTIAFQQLFVEFAKVYANVADTSQLLSNYTAFMANASTTDVLILYLPTLIDLIRLVMMIVVGLCFNRMYMTHCKKQIIKIKGSAAPDENPETLLQTKGGVNTALAVSLLITAMIIYYLPRFIPGLL